LLVGDDDDDIHLTYSETCI